MGMMKLATIVGTRPELIKLAEVIKLAEKSFDHVLIHTGQNYDYSLNDVFFEGYLDFLINRSSRAMEGMQSNGSPEALSVALKLSVYLSLKEAYRNANSQ